MTPVGPLDAEKRAEVVLLYVFNSPGVAGAVLQTPPLQIHSLTYGLWKYLQNSVYPKL